MPFSVQHSPLRAVDEAAARELIAQAERWWVERKAEVHVEALAEEIASFANSDGGWILVNIADQGTGPTRESPSGPTQKLLAAPQDWLGQKLRGRLDPVPFFEAKTVQIDGADLAVIRVPRSPLAPVLPTSTGVLYERGPAGKLRIERVARVRELVARRDDERERAQARLGAPSSLPDLDRMVGVPARVPSLDSDQLAVLVRATPLAFDAEAFEAVALSEKAAGDAAALLPELLVSFGQRAYANARDDLRHRAEASGAPMQRGFVMRRVFALNFGHGDHLYLGAICAADAGGAVAVRLYRRQTLRQQLFKGFAASEVQNEWLIAALNFLAGQILAHQAATTLLFDLWITGLSAWEFDWDLGAARLGSRPFGRDGGRTWIQASAEAEPTLQGLRRANAGEGAQPLLRVAERWTRDLAREAGFAVYEHGR